MCMPVGVKYEKIALVVILFEIWLACHVRNVEDRAMLGYPTIHKLVLVSAENLVSN